MISRRRRARAQAAQQNGEGESANTAPAAKPPKMNELPQLSAAETEELFSRACPSDTHYRKFLGAMEEARIKLGTKGYQKFEDKIARSLQFIEAGGGPLQAHFGSTSKGDIYKMSPGGSSMTTRLWIGRIRGHYYVLLLAHDVKSGAQTETRLIQDMEREIAAFDEAWKAEER